MHACPVKPSCKGGGERRPEEAAEELDGGVLSQLPHNNIATGERWGVYIYVCMVLAHGQRGRVLNTVRKAQKERKARQVLARVKVYSKSKKNVPYCIIVPFGVIVLKNPEMVGCKHKSET